MTTRATGMRSGRRAAGPLLAAVLLACAVPAAAGSSLDFRYGSPTTLLLPEINAMGGTGTALYRGGVSNVLNPACLAAETAVRLDAALALEQAHEDRLVPLFDTFEERVADTAVASNRNHYFGTGFGYARRIETARRPLTVAVSLTDRYSFAYDFAEEVRDPDPFDIEHRDQILQQRLLEVNGTLRALSGGAGLAVNDVVSLGAAVHYTFGSRDETRSQRYFVETENSSQELSSLDLDGVNFTLGARFLLGERLEAGLAYETPLSVSGNLTGDLYTGAQLDTVVSVRENVTIDYPRRWRGGFTYRPRSDPRTVFSMDAVLTEWTDLEDSRVPGDDNPQLLEDTLDLGAGVEHVFYNDVAARFGFRHVDSYSDREASMSIFSAGIGVPVALGTLAFSVELSKITSVQEHWFEYPNIIVDTQVFVSEETARVEDTRFRCGVGFTRSF